jgi:hypothetical protein
VEANKSMLGNKTERPVMMLWTAAAAADAVDGGACDPHMSDEALCERWVEIGISNTSVRKSSSGMSCRSRGC